LIVGQTAGEGGFRKMRTGPVAAVLLAVLFLAGLAVLLFTDQPLPPEITPVDGSDPPRIEALCGRVALGGMPRVQMRGDTTILVLDLDGGLYTMTQANLWLTDALRDARCELIETRARDDDGLAFIATYPDGRPLRIELKPVGSS
jgi:hypothetical protein